MKSNNKTKPQKDNINEFGNKNSQQGMNRFKTKSQTSEVIDGEYEIIKDNENKKMVKDLSTKIGEKLKSESKGSYKR